MNKLLIILSLIDDDVWKKVGGWMERSQLWLAMYHGCEVLKEADAMAERIKGSVEGKGYDCPTEPQKGEVYDTGENTSPYVIIPHTEKFQRACYILDWMDRNPEFHTYQKGGVTVQRYRPSIDEEVEKFLKTDPSKKEHDEMVEELGEVYAERWMAEIAKENGAEFERYGKELIDYIKVEKADCNFKRMCVPDFNHSDWVEDFATRLLPKVEVLIAGDHLRKIPSLPEKYGYATGWVRTLMWKLTKLEKALSTEMA